MEDFNSAGNNHIPHSFPSPVPRCTAHLTQQKTAQITDVPTFSFKVEKFRMPQKTKDRLVFLVFTLKISIKSLLVLLQQ